MRGYLTLVWCLLYAVPLARMRQDALRAAVEGLAEEGRELRAQVATTLQQVILY
eukprot:COSAG01_NODE_3658_length_5818_cov_3.227138_6_plen_54_part_00